MLKKYVVDVACLAVMSVCVIIVLAVFSRLSAPLWTSIPILVMFVMGALMVVHASVICSELGQPITINELKENENYFIIGKIESIHLIGTGFQQMVLLHHANSGEFFTVKMDNKLPENMTYGLVYRPYCDKSGKMVRDQRAIMPMMGTE